jgi:broad specificity phosphatase PhoE
MGTLILVRHGQASFGHDDYDRLSELGFEQSRLIGQRLAATDTTIDRFVVGHLRRQVETADTVFPYLDTERLEITRRADLNEFDHENLLGSNRPLARFDPSSDDARNQANAAIDDATDLWIREATSPDYVESFSTFAARVTAALDEIAQAKGTTVAVTSGGVISMMAALTLGLDGPTWAALNRVMANGSFTKIVIGRRGRSVISMNDHAHLEHDRRLITYR